jgi:UDP-N-acetyl-D-glucosamine dehydrogenase
LPLALAFNDARFPVLGFDIDPLKVKHLNAGKSYVRSIPSPRVRSMIASGTFNATCDFTRLSEADVIVICVPTPLGRYREPDLSFVIGTAESIALNLRSGQLVCLESTTYPGTTTEILKPKLEANGLRVGSDVFLAYSPEREDPGNQDFDTVSIPKIVGADDDVSLGLAEMLYAAVVKKTVRVSNTRTAEAVKITENVYRAVNIALVNELKLIYAAMDIDIWEVIDAAKTKPFGFSAFYPGPGLGGHCVPIDPFYLTWKAREFGVQSRFIELSGEINRSMPQHVIARLTDALSTHLQIPLKKARILIIGIAYKKNVEDTRESPAFPIIERLERAGADVRYYDPLVSTIPVTREWPALAGRTNTEFTPKELATFDAAIVCVDHDNIDWNLIAETMPLIIDTRNVMAKKGIRSEKIVKA